ncbi:MAG: precorrin-6y C5,15-methyltransferase (decarboxylating) subunit CbiE [Alphaproteobacteria bacterium]|nr:precorrin-6y C5,15-methyltransferase (decarboxylating) subunit CbiE [Alphaproteobacteria bacterium]
MTRWLSVIGIGDDGLTGLTAAARTLVDQAEVLVGGERHLAMVPNDVRERLIWTKPLHRMVDEITRRRGTRVCVLGTGDPMWHGIGATLAKHIPAMEMTVLPALSAYSLAAARLGWPLAPLDIVSLHGHPLERLNAYLQPRRRILALSENGRTPAKVAELLRRRSYERSRLIVLEHLGGPSERIREGIAAEWTLNDIADLNTLAIECRAEPTVPLLPCTAGLPDAAFEHDGQLTKREIRAVTLAALAPIPGQLLWDVAAGCGSIAIEWMRAHADCRAAAIERVPARLQMIAANAAVLGVPDLTVISGEAPAALARLDAPDAVFIGGGATTPGLFETCWSRLKRGGRLVANAVTIEGERQLFAWRDAIGGELVRFGIEHATNIGSYGAWQPSRPVTQFQARKP